VKHHQKALEIVVYFRVRRTRFIILVSCGGFCAASLRMFLGVMRHASYVKDHRASYGWAKYLARGQHECSLVRSVRLREPNIFPSGPALALHIKLHRSDESQHGWTVIDQLFPLRSCFISSCHDARVSKRLYTFLAAQIFCRSYVGSVYRMRSLAVSGFSFSYFHITWNW